jgi:hypothetical protein
MRVANCSGGIGHASAGPPADPTTQLCSSRITHGWSALWSAACLCNGESGDECTASHARSSSSCAAGCSG